MTEKDKKSKLLSSSDKSLWRKVTETVIPYITHKSFSDSLEEEEGIKPSIKKPRSKTVIPKAQAPVSRKLDRATDKKFKSGKMRPEAKLDLHGMTQDQAFKALENFFEKAVRDNKRTLIIITGKGSGVLKTMLPLWLENNLFSKHILAISQASIKDGGEGALYIRLKR